MAAAAFSSAPSSRALHYASTGICCIALVSARNTPIYLRSFPTSPAAAAAAAAAAASASASSSSSSAGGAGDAVNVRYEYIANAALDLVEERAANRQAEHYLGLLMTMEDLAVYGFHTSSRVKILVMLPATDLFVRDIDLLTIFRALHTAYLSYIANPFHLLPPILTSSFPSSSSSSASTAVFHPTPSAHFQPAPIFSADPALEQVAALQALGCRPIWSGDFEAHVEGIVGWTEVPSSTAAVVGAPHPSAAALASSGGGSRAIGGGSGGSGATGPQGVAAVAGLGAGPAPAVPV